MKKYKIYYNFDGSGVAIVHANSKKEAIEKYETGDALFNDDAGDNFQFDSIEKVEEKNWGDYIMSFTTSENLRIVLSKNAVIHYRQTHDWVRAYEIARREMKNILDSECRNIIAELEENQQKFLDNEFIFV